MELYLQSEVNWLKFWGMLENVHSILFEISYCIMDEYSYLCEPIMNAVLFLKSGLMQLAREEEAYKHKK